MKYENSGVNPDQAKRAKCSIAKRVKATWGDNVLSDVGAFGGLYQLGKKYKDPVLVSSIDGVGTKVLVARMADRYDTIGQDLVNHCVNDILVHGAEPLFFLDYLASGKLEPEVVTSIVDGIARACEENGCALIGGETAEMPGVYQAEDFDLAGCIIGVVEKRSIIDGSDIRTGDAILALPSKGLHTNGYSLAREIIFGKLKLGMGAHVDALECTVEEELLRVHESYLGAVRRVAQSAGIKGMAHITGGGVTENLPRILPRSCDARIEMGSWPIPKIFDFLQREGEIDHREMFRVFNMGLGMLVVVDGQEQDGLLSLKEPAVYRVGVIEAGSGKVVLS